MQPQGDLTYCVYLVCPFAIVQTTFGKAGVGEFGKWVEALLWRVD